MASASAKDIGISASARRLTWLLVFALAAVTAMVFAPAIPAGFVRWEDDLNIYQNPHVHGLTSSNLAWIFTDIQGVLGYKPLSWLTWAAIHELAGLRPWAYHVTNLILHCANSVLLFLLLQKLLRLWVGENWSLSHNRPWQMAAGIGSAVWALHPLRVEPVAWATGLPYGQALFFMLLSLCAYIHAFSRAPARRPLLYWISFGCFVAALLSHPVVLMFPVLLVLIDPLFPAPPPTLSRRRQFWIRWLPKLPFLVITVAFIASALIIEFKTGTWRHVSHPASAAADHAMQMVNVWAHFVWKVFWPVELSPVYTTPTPLNLRAPIFVASGAGLVILSYFLCRARRTLPSVWRLWLAHLALLVPVLGLARHPDFVSDRYGHLVGLVWAVFVSGLVFKACTIWNARRMALGAGTAVLCLLAALSARQVAVWENNLTLFAQALKANPPGSPYHGKLLFLLGQALVEEGRNPAATECFRQLLAHDPNDAAAHQALADLYFETGGLAKARFHYSEAVRLQPKESKYHNDLGVALAASGDLAAARQSLEQALVLNARDASAAHNLGLLLQQQGHQAAAQAYLEKAQTLRLAALRSSR